MRIHFKRLVHTDKGENPGCITVDLPNERSLSPEVAGIGESGKIFWGAWLKEDEPRAVRRMSQNEYWKLLHKLGEIKLFSVLSLN